MTNRLQAVYVALLLSIGCGRPPEPRELHVAAAANLRLVLDELSRAFQSKTGVHPVPTIAATAQLTQQIENGAPIDIFLSADTQHVDQLIARRIADSASRAVYAHGRLVLWVPHRPDIKTLQDLASSQVDRIGCARPELAPYGLAAMQALQHENLWSAVQPKIVYGQSISTAKQYADSGNVAASFTALALVYDQPDHYVLIDQALCIIKSSAAARSFRDFILGAEGQAILKRFGYQ